MVSKAARKRLEQLKQLQALRSEGSTADASTSPGSAGSANQAPSSPSPPSTGGTLADRVLGPDPEKAAPPTSQLAMLSLQPGDSLEATLRDPTPEQPTRRRLFHDDEPWSQDRQPDFVGGPVGHAGGNESSAGLAPELEEDVAEEVAEVEPMNYPSPLPEEEDR